MHLVFLNLEPEVEFQPLARADGRVVVPDEAETVIGGLVLFRLLGGLRRFVRLGRGGLDCVNGVSGRGRRRQRDGCDRRGGGIGGGRR